MPEEPTIIEMNHALFFERIGKDVSEKDTRDILTRLGFEVSVKKEKYSITVPSWRDTGDISIAPDIIEEVVRHV